jgi:hypothetical protein
VYEREGTADRRPHERRRIREPRRQGYVGGDDVEYDDGLPVVFSWPIATETIDPTDFRFTLNTGETVFGHAAGMNPNWENNERNTVVLFGDFGNRIPSARDGSLFPVKLEIVEDDTPLTLVGPGGREVSAVGLTWTTDRSPYDAGPVLVGAKLNRIRPEPVGEGGVSLIERAGCMPNDEFSLYDEGDFRLRVLTSGGFSPDGVTGLRPDMFEPVLPHPRDGCRRRHRGHGSGGRRLPARRWHPADRRPVRSGQVAGHRRGRVLRRLLPGGSGQPRLARSPGSLGSSPDR